MPFIWFCRIFGYLCGVKEWEHLSKCAPKHKMKQSMVIVMIDTLLFVAYRMDAYGKPPKHSKNLLEYVRYDKPFLNIYQCFGAPF